jgi:hypothetical protein
MSVFPMTAPASTQKVLSSGLNMLFLRFPSPSPGTH